MAPAKNSFSYADISFNGKLKKKKKNRSVPMLQEMFVKSHWGFEGT